MPRCDVRTPRLYVDAPLAEGASIALDASQANYLGNVLRLKAGDGVLVFNGRDGEWRGTLASAGKTPLPPPPAPRQPCLTRRAQVTRINLERMRANAIEAAEQCGIVTLPEIHAPLTLERLIAAFDPDRPLLFCDEEAEVKDPVAALSQARDARGGRPLALAVLIGPEGGFAADERAALLELPNAVRLALGPRLLRADTAAVAALAL